MAVTSSQLAPVTETLPAINSSFRRKYGIPPKGTPPAGGWADSDYGFPLPPADHPKAYDFARAVLSRAHQSKNFDPAAVAKQVRKAQAIVDARNKTKKKESGLREWSDAVPTGSWERQSALIQKAAQKSKAFGGPANDDPKADDADTVRSYDICVWASFPSENRVIIYNRKTSDAWSTSFKFSGDNVTFSNTKPVQILAESGNRHWRSVEWVDVTKANSRGGYVAANPRKTETVQQFLERCPGARPRRNAEHLSRARRSMREARARAAKIRESAGAVLERGATTIRERDVPSNSVFREAAFGPDTPTGDLVRNVILLREGPGNPADNHWYSAQCIEDAAKSGIFEGAQSHLDHPSTIEEKTLPERSVKTLVAWYDNVTCREYFDPAQNSQVKALYADMHLVVGRQDVLSLVRTCVEYARTFPRKSFAGLSIYASGDSAPGTQNGREYQVVSRITAVESVDFVTRAGAGGAIVPLKESFRMKTGAQEIPLVIDGDKVKSGVASLLEKQKTKFDAAVKKLQEGGVTLTDEQLKSLKDSFAEADADQVSTVIDEATGVAEGGSGKGNGGGAAAPAEDPEDDDETVEGSAMPDDVEALQKMVKELRGKVKAAKKEAATATHSAREATTAVSNEKRDRWIDEALSERNIPETFRPRLKREAMRESFGTKKDAVDFVNEFDLAYIRPKLDGSGIVSGGMRESGVSGGNFNFDEEN